MSNYFRIALMSKTTRSTNPSCAAAIFCCWCCWIIHLIPGSAERTPPGPPSPDRPEPARAHHAKPNADHIDGAGHDTQNGEGTAPPQTSLPVSSCPEEGEAWDSRGEEPRARCSTYTVHRIQGRTHRHEKRRPDGHPIDGPQQLSRRGRGMGFPWRRPSSQLLQGLCMSCI